MMRFMTSGSRLTSTSDKQGARCFSARSLSMALVLLGFIFMMIPSSAFALNVEKTTAKSNENGGTSILGGMETRVTWEATVGESESITNVTIVFPEGSNLQATEVVATVLEGLDRLEANESVQTLNASTISVDFAEELTAGTLIRLEFYKTALPAQGGEYSLVGRYTNGEGAVFDLPVSPGIEVKATGITESIVAWIDGQAWAEVWNSNKFLHLFFCPQLIVTSIPTLFNGWLRALLLVFCGFPLAIPIGLILSFMRMSKIGVIRGIASLYINVVRGTPLFLQMYIAFFGLPLLGLAFDSYILGIIVLAMNSSAYLAEIFRAGIQSIHKGQFEAAWSLGMNKVKTMFFVIIPQTVRRVIPTMTSEFILLYKDTSLLAAVGVMETMMFAKTLTATTGNVTPYIVAAMYYLVVTLPLIKVANTLEAKLAGADGQSSDKKPKKHRLFGRKRAEDERWLPDSSKESPELSTAAHGSM